MSVRTIMVPLFVITMLAPPLAVGAQTAGKLWRIGVLSPGAPGHSAPLEAFRQGLRDLGYVEGRNTIIEERFAEDRTDRLTVLARENITGLTTVSPELSGKRLELLREALPGVQKVTLLWNPANTGHTANVREMEAAGPRLRLDVSAVGVRREEDVSTAIQTAVNARAGALVVIDDLVISSHQSRILEIAARHRLPVISQFREFCEAGGLMAYGPNNDEMFRRVAFFVDKILKGAKPADLPVEQPTKFELVINVKTAKALGLTIPPALLLRADQVIQ